MEKPVIDGNGTRRGRYTAGEVSEVDGEGRGGGGEEGGDEGGVRGEARAE